MTKTEAQQLIELADETACAILTAKYEFFDILDRKMGAEYDRITLDIYAEKVPDMTMAELLVLANS
jgi:hypothetical protein